MADDASKELQPDPIKKSSPSPSLKDRKHQIGPSIYLDRDDEPRHILNQVAGNALPSQPTLETEDMIPESQSTDEIIYHKGVEIRGVQYLEQHGILNRKDVMELLDKLPKEYFEKTHLGTIIFEDSKFFIVERNKEIYLVRESDMLPKDKISRRARGITEWNSQNEQGTRRITDGKMTISIFSPIDWEGENDKDVALYSLAHEIGHVSWYAVDPNWGTRIWTALAQAGILQQFSYNPGLADLIELWKQLPESELPRYLGYKTDFTKEHGKHTDGETAKEKFEDVALQEDFATAHEYFLYWQNLAKKDSERFDLLDILYEAI